MARFTGSLGRPIQGISQQPSKTRQDGQCTESINLTPDIVRGLRTRTGSDWVEELPFDIKERDEVFHYIRDDIEEYFIIVPQIRSDGIKVYDRNGKVHNYEIDSTLGDPLDYLYNNSDTFDVRNKLSHKTVADTTFIANQEVYVQEDTAKSPKSSNSAIVYVQFMDYSQTQEIIIDGKTVATYTSPDGSDKSHKEQIGTDYVAEQLSSAFGKVDRYYAIAREYKDLVGVPMSELPFTEATAKGYYNLTRQHENIHRWNFEGWLNLYYHNSPYSAVAGDYMEFTYLSSVNDSGFSVERHGNTLFITKDDGSDFTLETSDDADGGNLIAVKGVVTDVSKLPPKAPIGTVVKILPKNGVEDEAYWLEARESEQGSPNVIWYETVEPETLLGLDNTTMPITLTRESFVDGLATFKLSHKEWVERKVGNEETNPNPSFINQRITAVGVFQNRLYLAANESLSMSRSSDFFNFYRTTTQSIVDTDPVDMYSDSDQITNLRQPILYNGDLYFFTDKAQVSLSGSEIITPNNLKPLRLLSNFEVQPNGRPVAGGENIFFPFDYGQFSGIREFFTDSLTDTKRARPITDHVNQLLKGRIRHMAASTSLNKLAVQTLDEMNTIYLYDWMWQGTEKVQSAWGKWSLPMGAEVRHFDFSEADLYLVYRLGVHTHLVRFELGDQPDDVEIVGGEISFALDHKHISQATRVSEFVWELPWHPSTNGVDEEDICFTLADGFNQDNGTDIDFKLVDGKWVCDEDLAHGSIDTVNILSGVKIPVFYEPSNPYPRDPDGTGRSGLDRLQIGSLFINYDKAGVCSSTIIDITGRERYLPLYPRVIGTSFNLVGFSPVVEGVYKVPVRAKSDRYRFIIETESHLPLQIREIEYDCNYSRRGGVF